MNVVIHQLSDMSLQAAWIILAVIVLRYLLRKTSRKIRLALWGIVAFRLICPFSFEAPYSLGLQENVISSSEFVNKASEYAINNDASLGNAVASQHVNIFLMLWLCGVFFVGMYGLIQYLRTKRLVSTAYSLKDEIMISDRIRTPFVMGLFRMKIYLPSGMNSSDSRYVIDHERMHIRYKDPIWKMAGWALLCIHWFNPAVWIAYRLFIQDIELVCDERVIEHYSSQQKADYSEAMVRASIYASGMSMVCPVGFGEVGVRQRIRSIMNYRKPSFLMSIVCVGICVIAAAVFLSHPQKTSFTINITTSSQNGEEVSFADAQLAPRSGKLKVKCKDAPGEFAVVLRECENRDGEIIETYMENGYSAVIDAEKGVWYDIGVRSMHIGEDAEWSLQVSPVDLRIEDQTSVLEQYRSPYVGDASNSAGLAMALPYGENFRYDNIELQTDAMPYGMTVFLKGTGKGTGLQYCAQTAFDLISNLDEISFCKADDGEVIASYVRNRLWAEKKEPITGTWVLTIGNDDISEISMQMENESLHMNNADGSLFKKGEQLSLIELAADADATVSARNRNHEVIFQAYVRNGFVEGMDMKIAEMDDWDLTLQ